MPLLFAHGINRFSHEMAHFSSVLHKKHTCSGYSLELPRQGNSNEYHNLSFNGEISEIIPYQQIHVPTLTVPILSILGSSLKRSVNVRWLFLVC